MGQRCGHLWRLTAVGLAFAVAAANAFGQARVLSAKGTSIVISAGSRVGVQVGMTGKVVGEVVLAGKGYRKEIATIQVTAVADTSCEARVTALTAGWPIKPDMEVAFDVPLPGLAASSAAPLPPQSEAERVRQRANDAWARQDWEAALQAYGELVKLNPNDSLARSREQEARVKLQQSRQVVMPGEGLERFERDNRAARERERQALPAYRDSARAAIAAGDWGRAMGALRSIAVVDPRDSFLQSVLASRREEAQRAMQAGELEAAVAACDVVLALVKDTAVSALRERATAAQVERIVTPVEKEADAVGAELAALEAEAPVRRSSKSIGSLMLRKVKVLTTLMDTQMKLSDARLRDRLGSRMRALAGGGMVTVPAGTFKMGCVSGDRQCDADEQPQRTVTVKPFRIDPAEVTVGQYRAFTASAGYSALTRPGFDQDDSHPVVNVSWFDAVAYCSWIGGRLPSEAEWERAARGGNEDEVFPWGRRIGRGDANYQGTGGDDHWERTAPISSFPANPFGLFDSSGNVWEWCRDWYRNEVEQRAGEGEGEATGTRTLRGGSWLATPKHLRSSARSWFPPGNRAFNIGFRCASDV